MDQIKTKGFKMSVPFIKVENLYFTYDDEESIDKHYVLNNLSLEIEKGSFVSVLVWS